MPQETMTRSQEVTPDDLQFLNAPAVEGLRKLEQQKVDAGEWEPPRESSEDFTAYSPEDNARFALSIGKLHEMHDEFLGTYLPQASDAVKADCRKILQEFSIFKMSDATWRSSSSPDAVDYGDPITQHALLDAKVQHLCASLPAEQAPQRPGATRVAAVASRISRFFGRNRSRTRTRTTASISSEADPTSLAPALEELETARNEFAKMSMEHGRTLRDKRKHNAELQEKYEAVAEAYHEANYEASQARLEELLAGGADESQISRFIKKTIEDEQQALHVAEIAVLDADPTFRGRMAKWARTNKGFFARSMAGGFGVGLIAATSIKLVSRRFIDAGSSTALAIIGGVTFGAGTAIAMAAKTTSASIRSITSVRKLQSTEHYKRHSEDYEELNTAFSKDFLTDKSNEARASLGLALQGLHAVMEERINENQRINRQRLRRAAFAGALGGLVGGLISVEAIEALSDGKVFGYRFSSFNLPKLPWLNGDNTGTAYRLENPAPSAPETPTSPPETPQPVEPSPPEITKLDHGFDRNVEVECGHGQIVEVQELLAEDGIKVDAIDAQIALDAVLEETDNAPMFTNVAQYDMGDGYEGFAYPKERAHLNPVFGNALRHYMDEQEKASKLSKKRLVPAA